MSATSPRWPRKTAPSQPRCAGTQGACLSAPHPNPVTQPGLQSASGSFFLLLFVLFSHPFSISNFVLFLCTRSSETILPQQVSLFQGKVPHLLLCFLSTLHAKTVGLFLLDSYLFFLVTKLLSDVLLTPFSHLFCRFYRMILHRVVTIWKVCVMGIRAGLTVTSSNGTLD